MSFDPVHMSSELDHRHGPVDLESSRRERREHARISVHWPIFLFRDNSAEMAETVTENLNCAGFFCFSEMPVAIGEILSCVLHVPSGNARPNMAALKLLCRVKVLRVQPAPSRASAGLACRIENYHCIGSGSYFE